MLSLLRFIKISSPANTAQRGDKGVKADGEDMVTFQITLLGHFFGGNLPYALSQLSCHFSETLLVDC
jgi:hypothetical protein